MTKRSLRVLRLVAGLAGLVAAIASGSGAAPDPGSALGLQVAIAAQERHTDALLDVPGVVGTGVGLSPAGRAVIRVYTETAAVRGLPAELDGVPVEAVVTGMIVARAPTDRFDRPVPIGVSLRSWSRPARFSRIFVVPVR